MASSHLHRPYLLHVSTLLHKLSHEEKMAHSGPSCPSCEGVLTTPPTVAYLLKHYPDCVKPQYGLNRRVLRCKKCDLVEANRKVMDAELPPPDYTDPVAQIEKHMQEARRFIVDGVRKAEMEAALVRMEEKRREILLKRDRDIRKVWEDYWGTWGPEKNGIGSLY